MTPDAGGLILLVEDDEDDVFVFHRALKRARVSNPVHGVASGQEAIEYLSGAGPFSDRERFPVPFLVFLDLKLPRVGGFEVLSWIRTQEHLARMVVVVLTSSDEERDHARAYALGARSYLVKPPEPEQLIGLFRSLEPFWGGAGGQSPILLRPP